jgi:hypothetical protein
VDVRVRADAQAKHSLRAIGGTYVATPAFDVPDAARKERMGFAVERRDIGARKTDWLPNYVLIREYNHEGAAGEDARPRSAAPI